MFYDKLEQVFILLYYGNWHGFIDVVVHTTALNRSYFNTHRIVLGYVSRAYLS